jgi:hypothetical protein
LVYNLRMFDPNAAVILIFAFVLLLVFFLFFVRGARRRVHRAVDEMQSGDHFEPPNKTTKKYKFIKVHAVKLMLLSILLLIGGLVDFPGYLSGYFKGWGVLLIYLGIIALVLAIVVGSYGMFFAWWHRSDFD